MCWWECSGKEGSHGFKVGVGGVWECGRAWGSGAEGGWSGWRVGCLRDVGEWHGKGQVGWDGVGAAIGWWLLTIFYIWLNFYFYYELWFIFIELYFYVRSILFILLIEVFNLLFGLINFYLALDLDFGVIW